MKRFSDFMNSLGQLVLSQQNHIEFDDLCYFYIELQANESLIHDQTKFQSELNAIKDHIKFSSMRYITQNHLGI